MIDSHCHLDHDPLFNNINEILNRSKAVGLKKLLTICTSNDSFENIKKILEIDEIIYGTYGIHPHESKNYTNIDSKFIFKLKNKYKKIIGIGETGLDFYYNHSDKKIQKKSFVEHISAASQLNIPVIVHSRNAETDTYEIIKSEKKNSNLKVLIHCFTGSKDFAKKLIDMNCYISVSGIITFNDSNKLADTVSSIPMDKLLVETDSPFLAPTPFRGKTNEPSYIKYTAEKLSIIMNTDLDIIKNHNLTKVLEFGSGPGKMADMIQDKVGYDISYTMIDKPNAKRR